MRPCIQWMVMIKDGKRVEKYSDFVHSSTLAAFGKNSDDKLVKETDVSTFKVLSISEGYCKIDRLTKIIRVVASIDYRKPKPHKKHFYIIFYLDEDPVHVSFVDKHKPRHNPIVIRVEDKAEIDHYSKIFADTVANEFKHIDKPILAYYKWLLDENMDSAMTVHGLNKKGEKDPRGMLVKYANGTISTQKNREGAISSSDLNRCPKIWS